MNIVVFCSVQVIEAYCYLVKQINEMSSGREQVQRAVSTLYPFIGLAKFQGSHTNQACYKSCIISPEYQRVVQHRFKSAKTNMIITEGFSERGLDYSVKSK